MKQQGKVMLFGALWGVLGVAVWRDWPLVPRMLLQVAAYGLTFRRKRDENQGDGAVPELRPSGDPGGAPGGRVHPLRQDGPGPGDRTGDGKADLAARLLPEYEKATGTSLPVEDTRPAG